MEDWKLLSEIVGGVIIGASGYASHPLVKKLLTKGHTENTSDGKSIMEAISQLNRKLDQRQETSEATVAALQKLEQTIRETDERHHAERRELMLELIEVVKGTVRRGS